MKFSQKKEIKLWQLILLTNFLALGWLLSAYLLGNTDNKSILFTSKILWEFFKAIFIASSAGLIITYFLKEKKKKKKNSLDKVGIKQIFESRYRAEKTFVKIIKNPETKSICLMGISLRDFLGYGKMKNVWEAIYTRLKEEKQKEFAEQDKFKVKILLLDPKSGAGIFRYKIEEDGIGPVGIHKDVSQSIERYNRAIENLYPNIQTNQPNSNLVMQARLYEHCPFSFIFLSEKSALIEQYSFTDHSKFKSLPLIEYSDKSIHYNHIKHSFNQIWEHAREPKLTLYPSIVESLNKSGIKNIYRKRDRPVLGDRISESLDNLPENSTIKIQAITGKFFMLGYIVNKFVELLKQKKDGIKIQFLILNPLSKQAILRAAADKQRVRSVRETVASWTWERHINSALYRDIGRVTERYKELKQKEFSIECKLTSAVVSSSLFITPNHSFIEQYFYGRTKKSDNEVVLGGEYPVIELEHSHEENEGNINEEKEIINSNFELVWNNWSVSLEEYEEKMLESKTLFEQNLKSLYLEIGIPYSKKEGIISKGIITKLEDGV